MLLSHLGPWELGQIIKPQRQLPVKYTHYHLLLRTGAYVKIIATLFFQFEYA